MCLLVMTDESWQTVCQVLVAVGLLLSAVAGYGAFVFGQRIERTKQAREATVGKLEPEGVQSEKRTVLSAKENVWPEVEMGTSGAVFRYSGPQGMPIVKLGKDSGLTVIEDRSGIKVSASIRDRTGKLVAELVANEWKVNPNNSWDRNYTRDRLEVKDSSGDVVLQIRVFQKRVQLQVKLYDADGSGLFFGNNDRADYPGGAMVFAKPGDAAIPMRITPTFKYPSTSHFGELSDKN